MDFVSTNGEHAYEHTELIIVRYVQSRAARQLSGDDMNLESKDPLTSEFATLTDCQASGA